MAGPPWNSDNDLNLTAVARVRIPARIKPINGGNAPGAWR